MLILEDQTLRDGLQSESRLFGLEEKIRVFNLLAEAGMRRIQIGSFVNPSVVPQMKDTAELIQNIESTPGVLITGLVLNERGFERAVESGLKHLSMSVSASDTHSRRNVRQTTEKALISMKTLISRAKKGGLTVRGGVQCAFGCVYEGEISEDKVMSVVEVLIDSGADEINLADTTGMGIPSQVRRFARRFLGLSSRKSLSLHLHDTRGLGLANMLTGYEEGVGIFDVCLGGLGGCPFVKGAAGNIATEDAVNMFEMMGIDTGIDLRKLCQAVEELESILGRQLLGRMTRVIKVTQKCDS